MAEFSLQGKSYTCNLFFTFCVTKGEKRGEDKTEEEEEEKSERWEKDTSIKQNINLIKSILNKLEWHHLSADIFRLFVGFL